MDLKLKSLKMSRFTHLELGQLVQRLLLSRERFPSLALMQICLCWMFILQAWSNVLHSSIKPFTPIHANVSMLQICQADKER